MKILLSLLFITSFAFPQDEANPNTISPAVAYWKTLTPGEKELYLFSYLTQVYETHQDLIKKRGYDEITTWYYENRAELIYGIFDKLEEEEISRFVTWIDEYYSHEEYINRPFYEAMSFAFRFQKASGETLWDKYENMKFDTIKPDND
ncbi:MAG: hypothetical protein HOD97_05720 [Candidatus Marinimicrobia bacterium]|jgi:hypothetical protein|nr:hypothetical protein [Candidatus Neomarinimicrobiota bacterium]MBT3617513.1 hypothetical protein [Candidatus Neomarinimicrobiota bacterium]MBT3829453.1 hypothetical protein [Candidatus Neomarinimicrobiota bacterium]MBT3996965.1 hypothetical protein [Candidatus Neomarinimicrobiota bacterium]MBT4281091.1 hypothetical protein [Candidatus Neomarinimicrobiota bacterium]